MKPPLRRRSGRSGASSERSRGSSAQPARSLPEVEPQATKPHACPCTPQARGRRRSEALVVVGGGEDLRFSDTGVSPGSAEQQAAPPLWEQLMLCCCARRAAAMTYTSLPQRCTHMFSTQMGAPPGRASSMPENDRQLHRGTSILWGPKARCSCEEVARRGAGPYLPMIWVTADHAGASRKAAWGARALGEAEQAPDVVRLRRG